MNKVNKDTSSPKKNYVLDTNIVLHDPFCLENFQEHDVTIPIPMLEELDKFKKGNESINHNAREFVRILQSLTSDHLFNGGVSLGKGMGKLRVALGVDYPPKMEKSFAEDTQDHRILAICLDLQKQGENVVLVSNDINLQIKAKALGILAESYKADAVKDMSIIYDSIQRMSLKDLEDALTNNFASPIFKNAPMNQYFIFGNEKDPKKDTLYCKTKKGMKEIQFHENANISGITPRNTEQLCLMDALLDEHIQLVAATGKAGTGKTLLALAAALKQKDLYEEVLVARPIVEMSDKTFGFLPGGIEEKVNPYMDPIYDNLAVIKDASIKSNGKWADEKTREMAVDAWAKENHIKVLTLNFIRGRTFPQKFIIIDEAQNLTPHEVKTIVTRAGEGTKIIFLGDIRQIDSPYMNQYNNGLSHLIDKWKEQPEFSHIHLTKGERSSLADKAGDIM